MALSCCRQLGIWKKADKFFLKFVLLDQPRPRRIKEPWYLYCWRYILCRPIVAASRRHSSFTATVISISFLAWASYQLFGSIFRKRHEASTIIVLADSEIRSCSRRVATNPATGNRLDRPHVIASCAKITLPADTRGHRSVSPIGIEHQDASQIGVSWSPARLTGVFCSVPSPLGLRAPSNRWVRVLSASLTDHVPKLAAKSRAAAPSSSVVSAIRFQTGGFEFGTVRHHPGNKMRGDGSGQSHNSL
jgi:hypothetical protein